MFFKFIIADLCYYTRDNILFTSPQTSFPHSKFSDIRGFGNKGRC